MHRLLLVAITLLPLLSSCMSMQGKPRLVIMQHPETMDFKNCDVGAIGFDKHFKSNEECVEGYKQQGYVVWGSR